MEAKDLKFIEGTGNIDKNIIPEFGNPTSYWVAFKESKTIKEE